MERVKKLVDLDRVQLSRLGCDGRNINVAILDTGICSHPDFDDRIINFIDCVEHKRGMYDNNGHGTHIAGIIGGSGVMSDGQCSGIAPKARLHVIKVLDHRGGGEINHILRGIEWVLHHYVQYQIQIVNISVGTVPKVNVQQLERLIRAVERLWDVGIIVVTAAGNYGPEEKSITVPGSSRKVITVGAMDDDEAMIRGGAKKFYSGRGPTKECICKPDIVAPGTGILSCGCRNLRKNQKNNHDYIRKSGTSMATAVVSGGIALLLSKGVEMSNIEVKLRLKERAVDIGLPMNQQGWGVFDIKNFIAD